MYSIPIFILCVLYLMKRAERQRRAATLELSQLAFDALPDDAKQRVNDCRRQRDQAARAARAVGTKENLEIVGIIVLLIPLVLYLLHLVQQVLQ